MLRFGPQIAIRVSPEVFFLTKGDASLSLPTYLYIDSTAANPRVVAVGEEISGVPELVRIDLFGSSLQASPPLRVGLLECLAAFLRAGVQKLVGRRTMIRWRVTVTGLASLDSILHGYQVAILRQALEAAGAAQIEFPEVGSAL